MLAALLRLCEARLFCDGPPDRFPAGIPVADLAVGPQAISDLASFDALFYNLGNDVRQHAWIFDIARLNPGIVVLHDPTLHRFFLDYYVQHLRRPDLYISRMAEHYGIGGLTAAQRLVGPRFDSESAVIDDGDLLRYTFTEEALRAASGAVVHSRWQGAIVEKLWSGPVCEAWLPAQRTSASSVPVGTDRDKLDQQWITLMTVGRLEPRTHVAAVIDVLAEDPDLAARTRYMIAGPYDPAGSYVRELTARIVQAGLARSVRLLGDRRPAELDRCARDADVFINLRYPDDEERSMSLMYELPFGKPVVTYDGGSFAEVPNEAVAKVAVGDRAGLRATLHELVHSAARRHAIGVAGKHFAGGHGARDYARELVRFAEQDAWAAGAEPLAQDASQSVAEEIALHIGETLASLGAKPGSRGVETVIREAGSLLSAMPGRPLV